MSFIYLKKSYSVNTASVFIVGVSFDFSFQPAVTASCSAGDIFLRDALGRPRTPPRVLVVPFAL